MFLSLPGSKGSLGNGHENKCLLEQTAGATGTQRTKFRPYAWTGKQSKVRLDLWYNSKSDGVRNTCCAQEQEIWGLLLLFLLFFLSPESLTLLLLMKILWAALFPSGFTILIFALFAFSFLLFLLFHPFLSFLPLSLPYLFCLLLLQFHVCHWSLCDLSFIPLLSLFLSFIFLSSFISLFQTAYSFSST